MGYEIGFLCINTHCVRLQGVTVHHKENVVSFLSSIKGKPITLVLKMEVS